MIIKGIIRKAEKREAMTDNQNGANLGEQMKGAVSDALQSGDFSYLNDLVFSTAENMLKEAAKKVSDTAPDVANMWKTGGSQGDQRQSGGSAAGGPKAGSGAGSEIPGAGGPPGAAPVWQQRMWQREKERHQKIQQDWQRRLKKQVQRGPAKIIDLIKFKRVGGVSGVLFQVFGGISLGLGAIAALVGLLVNFSVGGWIATALWLGLSWEMISQGVERAGRLKRAERYAQLCGNRMYGEVDMIAASTGQGRHKTLKDIKKMLRVGIFPEGHLDKQGKWFMLNDVVYKQYQDLENQSARREREALEDKEEPKSLGEMVSEARKEQESELNAMISEGMEYIRKLRDLNDRIKEEAISRKLYRLEHILNEIFDNVREHPEQMHRMHKLMEYYLPITLKLVEGYEEFDGVSAPGEDILAAKAEIEKTLDIINLAFTELLNNLFQDTVLDVTTDAQVLQTMLAQEGLTREKEFAEVLRK